MMQSDKNQTLSECFRATDLACRRGGRLVFEGLGFAVQPAGYLHLKGNNGSGKSTLLRLLAGLLPAFKGAAYWQGVPIAAGATDIIYSGHQHGLKPVLSLRENCRDLYHLMTGAVLVDAKLETAAEKFGLIDLIDQPLKYFSSGQTHRCALLRFLLLDRPIWLMDEPTVGLDAENRARLEVIMEAHLKGGGIIVAASHDPIGLEGQTLDLGDFPPSARHLEHWL